MQNSRSSVGLNATSFVHALSAGRADRYWHEGLAEHFEDAEPPAPASTLLALAQEAGRWPPPPTHAVARARTEFFVGRHGLTTAGELLRSLARGTSEDEALRRLTGLDRAGFDDEWRRQVAAEVAR